MSFGIINNNPSSIFTLRILDTNNRKLSKTLQKLSSGMRINRAADDAAGLGISEKMQAQLNGIDQARRNTQDAISMVQTAEGVLDTTQSIVQRMRKLAVQAATDNYTTYDRKRIQKEINELVDEVDRIGKYTEFNTKKLLDGSATGVANSNRDKVLTADVTGIVTNADYSITVLDAGSACHIHGNANLKDVSAANGGDADNIANLRDLGIYGDQELQITVDNQTRVINVNESDTLEDLTRKINASNVGVIAGLDKEGNDLTLTSIHSGSRFNISFGDDPDGVASKLGLIGGANGDNTSISHAFDSSGNDLGISLFTSGTDTIISITNITNQSMFPTDPPVPNDKQGISLGIFKSDSRFFGEKELSNTINNSSVFQFLGGSSSSSWGQAQDLSQSKLLKGLTIHIDEDISHGLLQQDDDDGGNTWTQGDYSHWTGYFDHTTSAIGDGENQGEVDPAVPNNRNIDPSNGITAAGQDDQTTNTLNASYDKNITCRLSVRDRRQVYHIGANEGQTITAEFQNMTASALGLATPEHSYGNNNDGVSKLMNGMTSYNDKLTVSVETQKSAEHAITTINNALNKISSVRARLGSIQNSLEKSSDYLALSYETGPISKIRDADMAQEMSELTKLQILQQSGTAMLAQANSKSQSVLQLLR
jgi:flagellin